MSLFARAYPTTANSRGGSSKQTPRDLYPSVEIDRKSTASHTSDCLCGPTSVKDRIKHWEALDKPHPLFLCVHEPFWATHVLSYQTAVSSDDRDSGRSKASVSCDFDSRASLFFQIQFRNVRLGADSASKTDGQCSNHCIPAFHSASSGITSTETRMIVLPPPVKTPWIGQISE